METGTARLTLDLKPALSLPVLKNRIGRDFEKFSGRKFKDSLGELLPRGLIPAVLALKPLPEDKIVNSASNQEIETLAELLKAFPLTPDGLLGFDWAIVTSGGVALKEIEPRTMRSKLVENLFFAGEVLDLDGPTGGFNLQMCWSTGYQAGESAADLSLPR